MRTIVVSVVLIILLGILGPQFLYTVDETQFVVITRFGEVREVRTSPGLKTKLPFIDTVNKLDKRLLRVDVPPASMPDVENQFLDLDAYVRYRITNPRRFRETLLNEDNAGRRVGDIVISELRAEIGGRVRNEIIGGLILVDDSGTAIKTDDGRSIVTPQKDTNGADTREAITQAVRERSDARVQTQDFGIQIIDVRIKRADFPAATQENVFTRMRTERDVQAQRLRAEGEEEFLTKTADVNRRTEIIRAEADERGSRLRGEGEGEAIGILAEALGQDPEFFSFLRSLEAYKTFLGSQTTAVLSADSDLFKFLQSPGSAVATAPSTPPSIPSAP